MLHSRVGSWTYPETLEHWLITKIRKLRTKKFYNIGPRYLNVIVSLDSCMDQFKYELKGPEAVAQLVGH